MSNEEFANWLTDNDDASELVNCKMCLFCASDKYDNGKWKCIQCCDEDFRCKLGIKEWLNQKVRNNGSSRSFQQKSHERKAM